MTPGDRRRGQSSQSVDHNVEFFRDSFVPYSRHVQTLDTYVAIREQVNEALRGAARLLDVGNGGVCDYDVEAVPDIVAVDLFLHQLPFPASPHVRFLSGSALALPLASRSFDTVVVNMLLHHLVGHTVAESLANVRTALAEIARVLRPGGRLVLIESCVPAWFYQFERVVFVPASRLLGIVTSHPMTLQYTPHTIADLLGDSFDRLEVTCIPKGRWVLQYGVKVPSVLTPVCPYRFVAVRRA